MNRAIVGYTGFVGNNLLQFIRFDEFYNSKNFKDAIGKEFDEIYISALPAEKWKANKDPETDINIIKEIKEILKTIKVKKVILISTIDVYEYPNDQRDEDYDCDWITNHHYGRNRRLFEIFIEEKFDDYHILRLPALFGKGLKKNVIYDLLNNNQIDKIPVNSSFQWYDLEWIYEDIKKAIDNNIRIYNLFTEPLETNEIVKLFTDDLESSNQNIVNYNTKTKHNKSGYIRNKYEVLNAIKKFISFYNFNTSRLRVSNICVNNIKQIQFASLLKLYGISNVQLAPTTLIKSWDNLNSLDLSSFYGINIGSLQSITYGISSNIFTEPEPLLKQIKSIVDVASKYKVKTLVFGCPKNRNKSENDLISNFVLFFRELGNYCSDKDVYICLEPNCEQYTNFLNHVEDTGNMVRLINNPNIKLMVDIGHIEDLDNIYNFVDIIYNVDISQKNMRDFSIVENVNKLKSFKMILDNIGYDGQINLEMLINNKDDELSIICKSLNNFISIYGI